MQNGYSCKKKDELRISLNLSKPKRKASWAIHTSHTRTVANNFRPKNIERSEKEWQHVVFIGSYQMSQKKYCWTRDHFPFLSIG
jgi:hypothetical protein